MTKILLNFKIIILRLIEQFYYVTFWHSKVKTDTFIKYHIQVYDLKYTIKQHQFNGKTMTSTTVKKHNLQS